MEWDQRFNFKWCFHLYRFVIHLLFCPKIGYGWYIPYFYFSAFFAQYEQPVFEQPKFVYLFSTKPPLGIPSHILVAKCRCRKDKKSALSVQSIDPPRVKTDLIDPFVNAGKVKRSAFAEKGIGKSRRIPANLIHNQCNAKDVQKHIGTSKRNKMFLARAVFRRTYGCSNGCGLIRDRSTTPSAKIGEGVIVCNTTLAFPSVFCPIPSDHRIVPKSHASSVMNKSFHTTPKKNQFVTRWQSKIRYFSIGAFFVKWS